MKKKYKHWMPYTDNEFDTYQQRWFAGWFSGEAVLAFYKTGGWYFSETDRFPHCHNEVEIKRAIDVLGEALEVIKHEALTPSALGEEER